LLTFAMLLTGLDFDSSFSAIVASINNTAHGFGPPGAVHNFHGLTPPQIWICTAAMLLGRLEIFRSRSADPEDLHGGDAARAARDLQRDRAVPPGLLAQVAAPRGALAEAAARAGAAGPARYLQRWM